MKRYYLALDIGGTKTSGAAFTEEGSLVDDYVHVAESQTFKGEEAVYQNTKAVLEEVIRHLGTPMDDVAGIGVGSPGPLDTRRGVIVHAPLMGWRNFPIVDRLSSDFRKPVLLDNDGNLGALAEHRCGMGKGFDNVLYMTVSTGCGGGIVLNGQLYRGSTDGAGEVGHMTIDPDGLDCPCGSKGCFELYASGTALNRQMQEDMRRGVKSRVFELAGCDPGKISGKLLSLAAEEGDGYAVELYRKEGMLLGIGIANQFNLFNPDVIVLGGGVTKAKAYFHEELMAALRKYCIQPVRDDSVRYSELNDRVVLYGAYYLIKEHAGGC